MKSKSRCSAVLEGLKGSVIGQVKPDIKKGRNLLDVRVAPDLYRLSCRKVSMRHLPITLSFIKHGIASLFNNNPEIGRPRITAFRGDKPYLTGFTLIELLVVVLIIGILASIAIPQYQKAVVRSRFATLKNLARSLADAEERYYLANGGYTVDIDALDIGFPQTSTSITGNAHNKVYNFDWGFCNLIDEGYDKEPRISCDNTKINLRYGIKFVNRKPETPLLTPGWTTIIKSGF